MENSRRLVVPGLLCLRRLPAAVPGWNDHYKLLQWYSSYKWALFLGYFILQIAQVDCKRLMLISELNPLLSQIFLLFLTSLYLLAGFPDGSPFSSPLVSGSEPSCQVSVFLPLPRRAPFALFILFNISWHIAQSAPLFFIHSCLIPSAQMWNNF